MEPPGSWLRSCAESERGGDACSGGAVHGYATPVGDGGTPRLTATHTEAYGDGAGPGTACAPPTAEGCAARRPWARRSPRRSSGSDRRVLRENKRNAIRVNGMRIAWGREGQGVDGRVVGGAERSELALRAGSRGM